MAEQERTLALKLKVLYCAISIVSSNGQGLKNTDYRLVHQVHMKDLCNYTHYYSFHSLYGSTSANL
jgi:hypothetical protein